MTRIIFFLLMLMLAHPASATYYVTGEIIGYAHGQIGKLFQAFVGPSPRKLYAVKGKDGNIHEIARVFEDSHVEYSKSRQSCRVMAKIPNDSANLLINGIVAAVNTYRQPVFLGKNKDGSYEELDVEYLIFKCSKA